MRRHLLPVVLVGLALAGCADRDDEPSGSGAGSTTSSSTPAGSAVGSSTTPDGGPRATATPADPFAIPAVIDAEYVNRVLAELYRIDGDVVRKILATNTIGVEDARSLRAIYNEPEVQQAAMSLARVLGEDKDTFKEPPGDRQVRVKRIVDFGPDCILSTTASDFSEVVLSPPVTAPDEMDLITLRPTEAGADPARINITGWSISNEEIIQGDSEIKDRARCRN